MSNQTSGQPSSQTFALSFSDHKQSALFFDKIWPLHSMDAIPEEIHDIVINVPLLSEDSRAVSEALGNMIMSVSKSPADSIKMTLKESVAFQMLMENFYKKRGKAFDSRKSTSFDTGMGIFMRVIVGSLIYELLTLDGYHVVPVFSDYKYYKKFFSTGDWVFIKAPNIQKQSRDSLQLNVNNLKLIATDRAEWQQVQEARKDKESIAKLRNLRVLFGDKYKDKDTNFISDDIDKRIDEYEQAAIKHGFELHNHVVTSFLDPQSLIGVAAITGISAFLGGPIGATVSTVAGAAFHTAKVYFEVKKKRFEYASELKNNEVAYIIEARDKLVSSKKWYEFWRR
jgi:hypothetical protein